MEHNNVQRYGDEYQCSDCGKAWGVDDVLNNDVPECEIQLRDESPSTEVSMLKAQVTGLKTLIQINEHRMNIPRDINLQWTPKQWYNHLNISKLRGTIKTHE